MILRGVIRINLSHPTKNSTYPSQAGAIDLVLISTKIIYNHVIPTNVRFFLHICINIHQKKLSIKKMALPLTD